MTIAKSTVVIQEHAYIYSMWSGILRVYEGSVRSLPTRTVFVGNKPGGKDLHCSDTFGEVYNAVVWFPFRDDDLAKNTLIRYELDAIAKLKEKIDAHINKISLIKHSNTLTLEGGQNDYGIK